MKKLLTILLASLLVLPTLFTACKKDNGNGDNNPPATKPVVTLTKDVHYSDGIGVYDDVAREESTAIFDKDIFYRNDVPQSGADPFVLYVKDETDTKHYGNYYLFGTTGVGVLNTYKSTDLVSWEVYKGVYIYAEDSWEYNDTWAPEVIWDKDANPADYGIEDDGVGQGVYFLFSSAGVNSKMVISTEAYGDTIDYLTLAVSASPDGPYVQWCGNELGASIGGVDYGKAENFAKWTIYAEEDLDTYAQDNYIGRRNDYVDNDDSWLNPAAARASLKFQYENREKAGNWVDGNGNIVDENTSGATYLPESAKNITDDGSVRDFHAIDANPFVDKDGTKYLYFARLGQGMTDVYDELGQIYAANSVYVVKFVNNDWTQIDYSSLTRITRNQFNFVNAGDAEVYNQQAQAFNADLYPNGVKETRTFTMHRGDAEAHISARGLNEGPFVSYNEKSGLYYLYTSTGTYVNNTYSVITAVAYSPLGPFRKLDIDEGGIFLMTNHGECNDIVTGPGHHYNLSVGDEDYIIYHRHLDLSKSQYDRGAVIDKIVWLENDYGMLVPYVNGPTTTIQPKIYNNGSTEYDNITKDATITVSGNGVTGKENLNDGAVQIHPDRLSPFVRQMEFTDAQVTITVKFDTYRAITALMVYQSYDYDTAFEKIRRIEMDVKNDGVEGTYVINDLAFPWDMANKSNGMGLRAGVAATATFNEVAVKEIRFTIDNYNIYEGFSGITAISEITILGKPQVDANLGNGNATELVADKYVDHSRDAKPYSVYGDITLDGNIADWQNQDKLQFTASVGGVDNDIETSTYFDDKGIILYYKVMGAPVYYNPGRSQYHNTGVEVYIAPIGSTSLYDGAFQFELFPNGKAYSTVYKKAGIYGTPDYIKAFQPGIEVQGYVEGGLNSPNSTGYIIEAFIPWEVFGYDQAPQAMSVNFALLYCSTYESEKRDAWVNMGPVLSGDDYAWGDPSTWFSFTKFGYFTDTTEIKYSINNGAQLSNGSVEVSGTYLSGGQVIVKPNDGYQLKSLKINGQNIETLIYNFAKSSAYALDIEVEFKPIEGDLREISVTSGFNYGEQTPIKNAPVTLKNNTGIYAGITDENGVLSINVPDGEYVVVTANAFPATIVVGDSNNAIELVRKVLATGQYNGIIVSDNGANGYSIINTSGAIDNVPRIDYDKSINLDNVYYEADVTIPLTSANTWLAFKFDQGKKVASYPYLNVGIWDGKLYLKPLNQNATAVSIGTLNADYDGDGVLDAFKVKIAVYMANNNNETATLSFFYDLDNGFVRIGEGIIGTAINGCFLTGGSSEITGNFKIENLKIYDGDDAKAFGFAKVVFDAPSSVEVDNSFDYIPYGASANVLLKMKPAQGDKVEIVTKILVNNQEVDYTVNDQNQLVVNVVNNDKSAQEIVVKIITKEATIKQFTLSVYTGFDKQNKTPYKGDITFASSVVNSFIIPNEGVLDVTLFTGNFIVTANGCYPVTVTIDESTNSLEIFLAKKIFDDSAAVTSSYNETDGYNFTTTNKANRYEMVDFFDYSNGFEFSYQLELNTKSATRVYPGLYVYGLDENGNTVSIRIQLCVWNGELILKDVILNNSVKIGAVGQNTYNLKAVVSKTPEGYFKVDYYLDNVLKISSTTANETEGSPHVNLVTCSSIVLYYDQDNATDNGTWFIKNFNVTDLK